MSVPTQPVPAARTPAPALHINFLDGLRGLAALYVVFVHFLDMDRDGLAHWQLRLASLAQAGHSSVTLFIVLSGFSLMLPVARAADGTLKGGTAGFLKRRARRILPPYYAALALSLLGLLLTPAGLAFLRGARDPLFLAELSAPAILTHLLLLHNLSFAWGHKINLALWSVATEWQIYFVLPFVLLPVWRRLGPWAMAAAGAGRAVRAGRSSLVPSFAGGGGGRWWRAGRGAAEARPAPRRPASRPLSPSSSRSGTTGSGLPPRSRWGRLGAVWDARRLLLQPLPHPLRRPQPGRRLDRRPPRRAAGGLRPQGRPRHPARRRLRLFHLACEKPFMVTSPSRNTRLLAEAPETNAQPQRS